MHHFNVDCRACRFKLFAVLSTDQIQSIAPFLRVRHLAKYEPIYCIGEPAQFVYLVEEGIVRTTISALDGRSVTLAILKTGDLFGEMALVGQSHHTEMSEAMRPSTILTIPKAVIEATMQTNPLLTLQVVQIIGARRLQIVDTLSNLLTTVPVRLARLLLRLAESYPRCTDQGHKAINLRLTHQEIGEMIGANREVVTATLNRFRHDGIICIEGHTVVLRNSFALIDIASTLLTRKKHLPEEERAASAGTTPLAYHCERCCSELRVYVDGGDPAT